MKAVLCLLTLCLAGYVSSNQYAWQAGKQYTYGVQARLFSGVSIATQYSGLQVRYDIILTVTGDETLHLNPTNFRAVELNSHLDGGWRDGELQNETPAEIKKELLEYLESPIELKIRRGVIDSIVVESQLPTWAINMKRAQASYFVADTTGVNVVISGNLNRQTNSVRPEESNQESGFFYETMEETVHGECETYYTISQNGPFDWPFQFQKQVQPGQQTEQTDEDRDNNSSNNNKSNESNQNDNNDSQQDQDSSEENNRHVQYAAFRQFAQRLDSGSAEDSHETVHGELPWPKAFATFCNRNDQVYEIVKSVNFTACKNKPVLAYSTNAGLHGRAGDNTIGSSLTRAVVTRYLACGKDRKQYTILKIEQEEQVNYGLRLDQKTLAGAVQNITLRKIINAQKVEQIRHPKTINDLTYTFDPREQQLQRDGKLQAAYFDVLGDNGDSSSSEENQNRHRHSTTTERNENNQEDRTRRPRPNRRPRSVSDEQNSQESSQSQESNEKPYQTDTEGRDTLRQPTLESPPINPLLVSPLQSSGMQKRVVDLMAEILVDILTDKPMAKAETLSKIVTVAKIVRYLNAKEILDLYHKLASKSQTVEDQTSRNVFLDAVSIGGTNPAIVTLIKLIKNGDITGEQASQLVMTFPLYLRTPTKAVIREIFNLVESPVVEKDLQLKTTAILALSNILYQANVNLRIRNSRYPVAQYGEFGNEKDVQRNYVPYFQKNVEEYLRKDPSEGDNKHWIVTYLTALGNLGVLDIVQVVQRVVDDSVDPYIKAKAILALNRVIVSRQSQNIPTEQIHGVDRNGQDYLTDAVVEKEVMPVLISVAFDKGEHPEVRMAAISLLLYTSNADVTIWQQLAYSTWFPASQEVHSFIYSSIKSLAYLDRPVPSIHYHMQRKARAVLALAKPITPGYAKSRNSFAAGVAEHLQSNYINQLSYFGSKDSNAPNYVFYKNLVQYGNRANVVTPLQISVHGHTLQKLAALVLSQYEENQENHKDVEQIYQVLGISRREQDEGVEGSLDIKIRDEVQRIWSVNEDVIERLFKQFDAVGLQKLMNGIPINYQKTIQVSETVFEMPSGLGVPVTFNFRMPVHVSLRGNLKFVEDNKFDDVQLQAELHPVYAVKTHARISFKVPFTGKKYQAGVQRHFVAEMPFRALIRIASRSRPRGQVVVALTPSQLGKGSPSGPIPILTFHQKPYTAIITDSLYPTTHKEGGQMTVVHAVEKPYKRQTTFGQSALGFVFQSVEESEYRDQNERSSGWINFWQRFHSRTCFFQLGWLGGEKVRYVERTLVLDIANSETKTVAFIFAGKYQQSATVKDVWQDSSSASSQSTEENVSSEAKQDSSSEQQNSNERENQSSSNGRKHGPGSGATHSSEDFSQGGYIYAAAIIGKRTPIHPVEQGKGSIQKILQKGTPSTVQYLVQISKSSGRVYIRAASGDAVNEAAKSLPQSSNSLKALREAIVESPNSKAQPDGCAEFEGEYDAPKWANRGELLVLRKRLLSEELVVKVKAELQFGQSCSKMPHEIKLQGKLERGPQMTEYAQSKSRQARKCAEDETKGFNVSPVCLQVAELQAAALNRGDLKITFTQLPRPLVNRTDDLEDFAKALLYPYVSTDRFHEGAGERKLRVEFRLTPNKEFLDVHITKPHSKLSFQSIRTNRLIRAVLPLTATQSLVNNIRDRALRSESDPSCSIEGNYVNTFDNVTYRFSQEAAQNCYHVFAQDCSGHHPISVLVKDVATNQKKVVIFLNARTKIELTPQERSQRPNLLANAKLQVEINDQRVESLPRVVRSKVSGEVIARIEKMNEGGIQVFTQYVDVAADGKYVVVFGSNPLRNRTCGLCGDFNGEKIADMKSPKNCPLSSGSALVVSYALKPQVVDSNEKGQCTINSQLKKQVERENQQCLTDPAYLPNNPRIFAGQENTDLLKLRSDCIQEVTTKVHEIVKTTIRTLLKPFFFISDSKKDQYALQVADWVSNKISGYMGEGSAQKISEAIASGACTALGYIPIAGSIISTICKLAKPLLVKGVLAAINPICKKTGCCTPSLRGISLSEYQEIIGFTLAGEPDSADESDIPYLSVAESTKSCDHQLEIVMGRANAHIVHALLQADQHMKERDRRRMANKTDSEVRNAVHKALKKSDNINIVDAVIDAVDRVMSRGAQTLFDRPLLKLTTKSILESMCSIRKCCYSGQH